MQFYGFVVIMQFVYNVGRQNTRSVTVTQRCYVVINSIERDALFVIVKPALY